MIGVPGDCICIVNKTVCRNGAALKEPYAQRATGYTDPYRDNFPSEPGSLVAETGLDMLRNNVVNGEVVVPAQSFFVLGDNRDLSLDSRYWGFVGLNDLLGKPVLIFESRDEPSSLSPDVTLFAPRRIRWNRLFRFL